MNDYFDLQEVDEDDVKMRLFFKALMERLENGLNIYE